KSIGSSGGSSCCSCGCCCSVNNWPNYHNNNNRSMSGPVDPSTKAYFYGKLTREQAEEQLLSRGCQEGLFLLRSSADANYAVSICHDGKVLHYNVERQPDNSFQIPNGKRFPGPVELINHHANHLDGFLTLARLPCNRAQGSSPFVLQGVTQDDIGRALVAKATELGYKGYQLEHILTGAERRRIRHLVLREFHQKLPWFHDEIAREEAERRLAMAGHEEGAFLVRCKRADDSFVLSLSYQREPKHYKVTRWSDKKLSVDGGKPFDSLVELVDHYHLRQEGLLCKLRKPVPFPGYCSPARRYRQQAPPLPPPPPPPPPAQASGGSSVCSGGSSGSAGSAGSGAVASGANSGAIVSGGGGGRVGGEADLISFNDWAFTDGLLQEARAKPESLPPESLRTVHILDQPWEEPDHSEDWLNDSFSGGSKGSGGGFQSAVATGASASSSSGQQQHPSNQLILLETFKSDFESAQKVYDDIPRNDVTFNLRPELLTLGDRLGGGNFGEVLRATYRDNFGREIPVAVKTLKEGSVYSAEQDILTEAKNMANLQHRHIVRLIGVCRAHTMMLVLELAPLGPINKYLKKHPECSRELLTELAYQVALGMQYLESQKFVHRDLAARNVLLVNRCHAKISDFGMSKTLGLNNDYYRAEQAGRWPLKWYSPESIYYFKFSSKSDVWSFGVTCWELFSYGDRPYKDKKGTEIIEMLERGERLNSPPACPRLVYSLMLQCWDYLSERRPSFANIVQRLSVLPRSKA
ncbi:hypothetical protein BOX15_Mlig030200g1, partial [Macrostomum lignano]